MTRKIFMTSVGISNYQRTQYQGLTEREGSAEGIYFPALRLRQLTQDSGLRFDHIFVLLTSEAKEKHWTPDGTLRSVLERQGLCATPINITAPQSERDLYDLVEQLAGHFEEGDELKEVIAKVGERCDQ